MTTTSKPNPPCCCASAASSMVLHTNRENASNAKVVSWTSREPEKARPESASCVSMSIPSPLAFQRSLTRLWGQCCLRDSSSRTRGWRDCYAAGATRRTFCCNRTGVRNDNFHRHLAVLRLHRGRDHPRHPAGPWATIFGGPAQRGGL